jgi:hypothetical protein
MDTTRQAKMAWILWNLIGKLHELLWNHYADSFLNFYLHDEDKKYLESIENLDDIPF